MAFRFFKHLRTDAAVPGLSVERVPEAGSWESLEGGRNHGVIVAFSGIHCVSPGTAAGRGSWGYLSLVLLATTSPSELSLKCVTNVKAFVCLL